MLSIPGGKHRIGPTLLTVILASRKSRQAYVEPFVGGASMIQDVPGSRIAADQNHYLIAFYKAIQNGWLPPKKVSRKLHRACKINPENFPPELVAFVGFASSYSHKWFNSYIECDKRTSPPRTYAAEAFQRILRDRSKIQTIKFFAASYEKLKIPAGSLIYCDPPYTNHHAKNTYGCSFDIEQFWLWAATMRKQGHTVFVSSYVAPKGWKCVWSAEVRAGMGNNNKRDQTRIERLWFKI